MSSRPNSSRRKAASSLILAVILTAAWGLWLPAARAAEGLAPATDNLWRLVVNPAAAARGERLRLKEIAAPGDNFPPAAWKALSETLLWKAPSNPGGVVIIAADKVVGALRYYLREAPLEYVMPSQVAVRRGGSVLFQERVKTMAVEYLTPRLTELPGQAVIGEIDAPVYVFLDSETDAAAFEVKNALAPGRNQLYLIETRQDGKAVRKTTIPVDIQAFAQVAVASRPINVSDGQIVPDMTVFERKDLSRLKGRAWDGSGGPWRIKTAVGQGQVIYADNLEPMPTIIRGDKITLAYRSKRIRLSALAEAVTDGFLGEPITVRNLQSGSQVTGVVEGPGSVVVQ
jgi:flagellar basal body P-ring formation protein FlgA